MIDLHCHILPEMDDGSTSYDESFEMAETAVKNKIEVMIATPHFSDFDSVDEFVFMRDEKAVSLNKMINDFNLNVVVGCGAEVYLSNRVFTAGNLDSLTINGSKYMLCEYSLKRFDTQKAVIYAEEILSRGYIPIIAHPERYISFFKDRQIVNELWDMGCRFQVNASSLAGRGGENMQDFAADMILRGFVDFVATDAHSPRSRNNKILSKIKDFPDEITNEKIEYLTLTAPLKVIKKEKLDKKEVRYFP